MLALLLNHARAADKASDFASNLPRSVACLRAPRTSDQIVLRVGNWRRGMIDNGGPAICGVTEVDSSPQEEMAAFEQLGPQVRAVLNETMCVEWSAVATLAMIRRYWRRADPKRPAIDSCMAALLSEANAEVVARLRAEDSRATQGAAPC
jgi:hypothetical protein